MDPATLKQKLLEAGAHVALINQQIDRQRELIEMLRKRRLDTGEARRYLTTLEERRTQSITEMRRLATLVLRNTPSSVGEETKL